MNNFFIDLFLHPPAFTKVGGVDGGSQLVRRAVRFPWDPSKTPKARSFLSLSRLAPVLLAPYSLPDRKAV